MSAVKQKTEAADWRERLISCAWTPALQPACWLHSPTRSLPWRAPGPTTLCPSPTRLLGVFPGQDTTDSPALNSGTCRYLTQAHKYVSIQASRTKGKISAGVHWCVFHCSAKPETLQCPVSYKTCFPNKRNCRSPGKMRNST